jgi:hypothetical protein
MAVFGIAKDGGRRWMDDEERVECDEEREGWVGLRERCRDRVSC